MVKKYIQTVKYITKKFIETQASQNQGTDSRQKRHTQSRCVYAVEDPYIEDNICNAVNSARKLIT